MLGGVAAGIAEFIDVDRVRVRWVFGLSAPLTLGLSAVVYLLLWALLPAPPPHQQT